MSTLRQITMLVADDDPGHVRLIQKNLQRSGLLTPIEHFSNGQDLLDFLFRVGPRKCLADASYLILLDIRMPRTDGVEALRQIKAHPELKKIPVIMLTTTDDPREVERCHALGCNNYIVKPVDYEKFSEAIKHLGLFVGLVQVPEVHQ